MCPKSVVEFPKALCVLGTNLIGAALHVPKLMLYLRLCFQKAEPAILGVRAKGPSGRLQVES